MKDPQLLAPAAAKRAGMSSRAWRTYVQRGAAPAPDGHDEVSGTPWWWQTTVDAWLTQPRQPAHRPRKAPTD